MAEGGILDEYVDRDELCRQLRISGRTAARYENAPDGLPSVTIGGRKLYRIAAVAKWLAGRESRPNPRRQPA